MKRVTAESRIWNRGLDRHGEKQEPAQKPIGPSATVLAPLDAFSLLRNANHVQKKRPLNGISVVAIAVRALRVLRSHHDSTLPALPTLSLPSNPPQLLLSQTSLYWGGEVMKPTEVREIAWFSKSSQNVQTSTIDSVPN